LSHAQRSLCVLPRFGVRNQGRVFS
jgi:hypothetical protein